MQALQEPKAPFENRRPPSGLGFVMGRGAPIASTRLALEHICCVGHWRTTRLLYNWTLEGHCFYISLHADSLYYNWIYVYICEVALLEILFVCFHVFLNWMHIVSRLHNIIAISNLLFVECQGMNCNAFAGFLFMWTTRVCSFDNLVSQILLRHAVASGRPLLEVTFYQILLFVGVLFYRHNIWVMKHTHVGWR